LMLRSLISYEPPLYQVLSLPPHPLGCPARDEIRQRERQRALYPIRKIKEAVQ
jgi:hypothetical protein